MKKLLQISSILLLMWVAKGAFANFINVQNTTLTGQNTTAGLNNVANFIQVQYDLSWNNSWRDSINWDGAWVFVKYRIGTGNWTHAHLDVANFVNGTGTLNTIRVAPATINTGYLPAAGINTGAFVYRAAGGTGTFSVTGQQLRWLYGAQSVTDAQALTAQLRVFAVEMVYIPQGNYFLGDNSNTANDFHNGSSNAVQITGTSFSSTISAYNGGVACRVHGNIGLDVNNDGQLQVWPTDNSNFPAGWKAFWMMKYEISQGQYVDFLNTLTYDQQTTRMPGGNINTVNFNIQSGTTTDNNRYTIRIGTTGVSNTVPRVFITVRPDRANNWMNWQDGSAYADWAGLRPHTELEFEKAARGFLNIVSNENAWGNTTFTQGTAISGTENGTETITTVGANSTDVNSTKTGGDGNTGPVRVGIHATASSTRTQSGASYFGVMDLTSNVCEMYVGITHTPGRLYRGDSAFYHGNGMLFSATNGNGDVPFWVGNNSTGSFAQPAGPTFTQITGGYGAHYRGCNSAMGFTYSDNYRTADRGSAGTTSNSTSNYFTGIDNSRYFQTGFRCGRTHF
jgi:formylglycine-generating enzyme required for sulfatase activity